jgi:hypothetical protein
LEAFSRLLCEQYPTAFHPEMTLQYADSEEDKCTITTELEWQEMRQELEEQPLKRVWVVDDKKGQYFKDGPAPELVKVYSDVVTQEPEPVEVWEGLQTRVTKALANLFPGGNILPLHLPSFLDGVVKLKTRDDRCVDLDVDIASLSDALHRRAYNLLSSASHRDINEAKNLLVSQLILSPTNTIALYNLACADALLGNAPAALQTLQKAIEAGYTDVAHMMADTDLDSLRSHPSFLQLMELAQQANARVSEPEPEVAVPEPVYVPEEPKEEIKEEAVIDEIGPEPVSERKWGKELLVLAEMGFLDESILISTLDKTEGDVSQALMDLLG